ncbi:MAG: hypothetical protein JWM44_1315 [Bacilli bacterium]|nr:hypothetical protein [Bacilli bacterium]
MSEFGDIEFQEVGKEYSEGMYDGRKFILYREGDEILIDGNFSDDERAFIFAQWEMRQPKA